MARIGYVRVSAADQNTGRQEVILERLGVEKVFIEKASGKNANRPQLRAMLDYVREGDTLIVESYSRLARSTRDLLEIVDALKNKGVEFVSQKEAIDTVTPSGQLMMTIFAGLVQYEREVTHERQAEGIALAKAQGKYKGRKPMEYDKDEFSEFVRKVGSGETSVVYVCKRFGISRTTYYRRAEQLKGGASGRPRPTGSGETKEF